MKTVALLARWIARLLGIYITIDMVSYIVGEGIPYISTNTIPVQIGYVTLVLALGGIIVGWFRELVGGLILVGSYVLFSIMMGGFLQRPAFPYMIGIGTLYLVAYFLTRKLSGQHQSRKEKRHHP